VRTLLVIFIAFVASISAQAQIPNPFPGSAPPVATTSSSLATEQVASPGSASLRLPHVVPPTGINSSEADTTKIKKYNYDWGVNTP